MRWLLGLSLGYSRLQLAVGRGDGSPLRSLQQEPINPDQDAAAVQLQVGAAIERFLKRSGITKGEIAGVGCGFRGPVDPVRGIVRSGPHGRGWEHFPLAHWLTVNFDWPAVVFQDTEGAALAESAWGAGRGFDPLLYIHAGSQIEAALILGSGKGVTGSSGQPYRGMGQAVGVGHLRPGSAPRYVSYPATTVNALASGVGLAQRAERVVADWQKTRELIEGAFAAPSTTASPSSVQATQTTASASRESAVVRYPDHFAVLLRLAGTDLKRLNAEMLARAASQGDRLSRELFTDAISALGWGVAQAITLFHPARVVIGGGLTQMGPELFFEPLRRACRNEVSPLLSAWKGPSAATTGDATRQLPLEIVSGTLVDTAAAHGGLLLAKRAFGHDPPLRAFSADS